MDDIERLEYEYNELVKLYTIAREYTIAEKDQYKREEYKIHLLKCYDLIKAKKDRIDKLKKKSIAVHNNADVSNSQSKASTDKKYYFVKIYHPFLTLEQMKYLAIDNYRINDKLKEIYYVDGTRTKKGIFVYRQESYRYRVAFPIIVEKDGNRIYDLLTGDELMEYKSSNKNDSQIRYKGNIYYADEKYISDKIVVELGTEINKMVLADLLRKLDYSGKNDYTYKMGELKRIILNANRDYYEDKKRYAHNNPSDDEIIKRYRGR